VGFYDPPPFVDADEQTEGQPTVSYRVIKTLVIARDQMGKNHYHYHGAIIPWLNPQQEAHFLRLKLVEKIAEPTPAPAPAASPAPVSSGKPPRAGSHEAWVKYAVSQGLSESEAKGKSKQELIEALG
jgi:hypothetical protein